MNSPDYSHLAQAYDQLFPLDPEAFSLVTGCLGHLPGKTVVDAGCGTGLMVRALADAGARAHGFDLDPSLLQRARERMGDRASFSPGDLRNFDLPDDLPTPQLLVCLGNTLPHLTDPVDLDKFLARAAWVFDAGSGLLVLQVLDYDFLERGQRFFLPERRVDQWVFRRHYTVEADGLWVFHTTLEGLKGTETGAFPLRPYRRADLETALVRAGFRVEGVFGGFDRRPPGASLPLVLLARLL